jgi:hypothetical protein
LRHEVTARSNSRKRQFVASIAAALLFFSTLMSSGCATLNIPAFDPTGNRIFASAPTQLTPPLLHGPNGTNIAPNPNFPEPPDPPACLQGPRAPQTIAVPTPRNNDERGRCGQMLLTPTRIVAPVGGEVVLLAGICGEDGYLVSGEPIEWMLSPDSVGEIIEVGDDMKGKRKSFFTSKSSKPVVEKLDVDFARGRTSAEPGRITRGSLRETDDLIVRKGQTWVSLTSPTEGMSRVTVLAPDSDVWDRRRQTATIYWIDASWQFPAPLTLRVGEPATLITHVKKAEGFAPATGWIVKYRLLTEGLAQFRTGNPNAMLGADIQVDTDGKAITQLINTANQPGTAIVGIEVVRPNDPDAKIPDLPIARGQTIVTWSAPILKLEVNGSDTVSINQPVDYTVTVSNAGDLPAENVRLVMDLKNPSLQASFPLGKPDSVNNLGATWNIASIPARSIIDIPVRIQPTAEGDFTIGFLVNGSNSQSQVANLPLRVVRPQIGLKFAPAAGNEQAEINQPVVLELIATNTGRTAIDNLTLLFDSAPGLQHESGSNQISETIRYLGAGQSQRLGVRYIVRKSGELSAKVIAKINNVAVGEQTTFVRGIEPVPRTPGMAVQLVPQSGNASLPPGGTAGVSAVVQNRGQTLLSNIQVVVEYDGGLELTSISAGGDNRPMNRMVAWTVPSLEPGKQITFDTAFRLVVPNAGSSIRLSARSAEGIAAQNVLSFNTGTPAPTEPPILPGSTPGSDVMPSPSATGGYALDVQPLDQALAVGGVSRLAITFRNNFPQPDQNIAIEMGIPQGVSLQTLTGSDGVSIPYEFSPDGLAIRLEPIRNLRPGEPITFILELRHNAPGAQEVAVSLRSAAQVQPIVQRARISVRPNL